jgi:hypothetical protein
MTGDDTELATLLEAERAEFAEMFRLTAKARALEAEHDHRYHHAAVSLQKIAATMGEVDDAMLLKLAKVNQTSDGLLSVLLGEHLKEIAFALPCYENAAEFFAPVVEQVDAILRKARQHVH